MKLLIALSFFFILTGCGGPPSFPDLSQGVKQVVNGK